MYRIIGTDGVEYGPVSAEQLKQWIAEGRANARTQVRAEGQPDWRPLQSFPELASTLGPPIVSGAANQWAPPGAAPGAEVPNYLVQSILVTLFCCLPFGIAAIVYASQVDPKLSRGDIAGAQESSRKAKLWCLWSLGVGGGLVALYSLVMIAAVLSNAN